MHPQRGRSRKALRSRSRRIEIENDMSRVFGETVGERTGVDPLVSDLQGEPRPGTDATIALRAFFIFSAATEPGGWGVHIDGIVRTDVQPTQIVALAIRQSHEFTKQELNLWSIDQCDPQSQTCVWIKDAEFLYEPHNFKHAVTTGVLVCEFLKVG